MRKHLKTRALCYMVAAALPCAAQSATENGGTEPFDFSYRVTGAPALRPHLVFNDGRDTYIEIDANVSVSIPGGGRAVQQGPYYVVRGLQSRIILANKSGRVEITYEPRQEVPKVEDREPSPTVASIAPTEAVVRDITQIRAQESGSELRPQAFAPTEGATQQSPEALTTPTPAPTLSIDHATSTCAQPVAYTEAAYSVAFPKNAANLARDVEASLVQAAQTHDARLQEVQVRVSANAQARSLQRKRFEYLADLFVSAGIPRGFVTHISAETYAQNTEVVFIGVTNKACGANEPVVSYRNGMFAVTARSADVAVLLEEMARHMKIPIRMEGSAREIPVDVEIASARPATALAEVGERIGGRATILLRDNELVLRFN